MAFVNEDGTFNLEDLIKTQKLSAKVGYRMATTELELHDWNLVNQEDMLTGCSLTGVMDFLNATKMSEEEFAKLLQLLRKTAREEVDRLAEFLGTNKSKLVTTIKPSGCWTKEFFRNLDNGLLFIDEINENIDEQQGFQEVNGYTTRDLKVLKTYKNEKKEIYKIILQNNRELKISPEHPMAVYKTEEDMIRGRFEWIPAKDLKSGMIIVHELGNYNKTTNAILKGINDLNGNNLNSKTPNIMNQDLSYLLGSYYAAGEFTTSSIKITTPSLVVAQKIQQIWLQQFGIKTEIIELPRQKIYCIEFSSNSIFEWFAINGISININTLDRLPKIIRTSSKEVILSFFAGYIDNKGTIIKDHIIIEHIQEQFAKHLQQVGEAVGLSFILGQKMCSQQCDFEDVFKLELLNSFSNEADIEILQKQLLTINKIVFEKEEILEINPYTIKEMEIIEPLVTYDIEVEDEHWYYQGGLKSHNTISQLPTVSSGVHFSHSPYYIRRVRINANDPMAKALKKIGFPWQPENGQTVENHNTAVFEIPVKAPEGKTKYDVSAIEQLELYKLVMKNYVDHNASNTIHVRDHEWEEVENWVYENWDDVVGITFLSLDDSFYNLMPYEAITKEKYEELIAKLPVFNPKMLREFENFEEEFELDSDCDTGACPIR